MRLIRYRSEKDDCAYGAVREDGTVDRIAGDPFGEDGPEAMRVEAEDVSVEERLAPVDPPAILGIGLNYQRHAEESGVEVPEYPVLFTKTPNAVQRPGGAIELPRHLPSRKVDYECELAVVIGSSCKNVGREEALDYVLGYTCANDVSARDWQLDRGGGQWSRGKSFDTFCPLGPELVTTDELGDPHDLEIRTEIDGEVLQDWTTGDMIFGVPELIEFLSGSTTLASGTVILTGTPHGVGMARTPPRWLEAGDEVTVEIEGIGRLTNAVREERV